MSDDTIKSRSVDSPLESDDKDVVDKVSKQSRPKSGGPGERNQPDQMLLKRAEDMAAPDFSSGARSVTTEQEASGILMQFVYQTYLGDLKGKADENAPGLPHFTSFDVGRQLAVIGDSIETGYAAEFDALIKGLKKESAGRRRFTTFISLLGKFIDIIVNSVNFPVHLIKLSIQILIAIWQNPNVLEEDDTGDVPDSAELVVQDLEERAVKTYLKALMNENETARHIRIMVIGMFGAGKTSLVKNLLNDKTEDTKSTDGIDIHVNECYISENDEWLFQESSFAKLADYKYRVAAVMSKSITSEKTVAPSTSVEIIYQREKDNPHAEKKIEKQASVSAEAVSKTKAILETFKDADHTLRSFRKDFYEAWILSETNLKEGRTEIKSSTQATVSVWDFAGQDVYYSTHHFFMNPASVYLLTMNISIPLMSKLSNSGNRSHVTHFHSEATYLDAFRFWLNSVHTYSAKYGESCPTVILVGTHIDELKGTPHEKRQEGEDYFDEALKSFIDSPVLQHVHTKKFFVDNTNPEEDFNSLRREILELARKHRSWNQVVPARWILLERSLEQLRSEGHEMITVSELMDRDNENEYPVGNRSEVKEFLRFQHSLGNLLYFDTVPLESHIILSPQWIVDAFRCFVTSFPKKDPADLKLWDEYEKQAKLHPTLLHSIIDNNKCLVDYKDEVVKYMEHLDIMAQPSVYLPKKEKSGSKDRDCDETKSKRTNVSVMENGDKSTQKKAANGSENVRENIGGGDETTVKTVADAHKDVNGVGEADKEKLDFYIVPSMLSARPSKEFMEEIVNPSRALKTSILCFMFSGEFLPPAIFHRLVAVCINKWPVSIREKQFLLFRGFTVFCLTSSVELAMWMQDHAIFCRAIMYTTMKEGIPDDVCIAARTFIRSTLEELLGIYKDKWSVVVLPFEEYIQCDQTKDPLLGLIPVKDLASMGESVCKAHSVAHVMKSAEVLAHWYPTSAEGTRPQYRVKNVGVIDLCKIPTVKELSRLSSKIGHEYFRLGLELSVTRAEIQHCQENHKFDVVSIIFCVLQKWKEANGVNATLEKLKVAMETVDCDMDGFYEVFALKSSS